MANNKDGRRTNPKQVAENISYRSTNGQVVPKQEEKSSFIKKIFGNKK